jgi:hypothetical protein
MAATTGTITKSYVSALDPMLDTREINKLITDVYNEDELSDILGLAGRKQPTKQPVYYTFYDDPLIKFVDTTDASVSGSGSTQVTTAVTAATSGYARKGDLVMCTNNNVGIIYSISTSSGVDTLVIKSPSGANLTVTAGDKLSLFSRAVGENSYTPANIRYGLSKQTNKYQIFRETSRITDVQSASTIEVEFQGQPKYIFKDHWEKKVKMKSDINAAFWGGDMSVTSYSDANPILTDNNASADGLSGNGAVQTTRGINKYVELYGTSLVNGTLGTYSKANLDDLVANLIAIRAPREYLACSSTLAKTTTDTYFKSLGSSGVTSVRMVVNGKELDMEVDKVRYGKFTFNFTVMPILDHPVTFGYSKIPKCIYFLPYNNKVKVEGGGSDDQIRVRYVARQTPFGDDMTNEVHYGALNVVNPNGEGMFNGTDWVTAQGLEVLAPQHLIKQQVIA